MKTLLGLTLAMILATPLVALAQDSSAPSGSGQDSTRTQSNDSSMNQGDDSSMKHGAAKSGGVKGTISQDGKSLVGDTDGKSWTIANPDAVKGHEGHHVELKGSADASTGEIQVTSVKMLKGEKGAMKKDDSMQK